MRRTVACCWFLLAGLVGACGSAGGASPGSVVVASGHGRSQIAIVRNARLVIFDVATGRQAVVRLPRRTLVAGASGVGWSPDGRRLVFSVVVGQSSKPYPHSLADLFVANANGSGLRRITHLGAAGHPVWSPDGRTIVFAELGYYSSPKNFFKTGSSALWRVNADGSQPQQLTPQVPGREDMPGSYAPEGSRLAFTRYIGAFLPGRCCIESSSGDIDLMAADGSITTLAKDGSDPAFSPNGHEIAFTSDRDRTQSVPLGNGDDRAYLNDLYVMRADGKHARRLTNTPLLNKGRPTWSPDSARIAYDVSPYAAQVGGFFRDYVAIINADGTCRQKLAQARRTNYALPAWRPGRSRVGDGPLRCTHG
jgi:Tol biopolymer transport system component